MLLALANGLIFGSRLTKRKNKSKNTKLRLFPCFGLSGPTRYLQISEKLTVVRAHNFEVNVKALWCPERMVFPLTWPVSLRDQTGERDSVEQDHCTLVAVKRCRGALHSRTA